MRTRPHAEVDRGHTAGRATRRLALALMVTAVIAAGCSSSSTSAPEDQSTTTSTIDATALEVPTHVDPAVPITAEVGREFAIMLPADPGAGWRWVLAPIDNARLVALGSRFSDDPDLLVRAETATTTTSTTAPRQVAGATTSTTTTTTTPPVLPLVQVISFAGKSPGATSLSFSYTRIAGADAGPKKVITFSVQVVPTKPTTTTSSTTSSSTTTTTIR